MAPPNMAKKPNIVSIIFPLVKNRLLQRTRELPALIVSLRDGRIAGSQAAE